MLFNREHQSLKADSVKDEYHSATYRPGHTGLLLEPRLLTLNIKGRVMSMVSCVCS